MKSKHRKLDRPIRIFYMGGAGDSIGSYRYWKSGVDDPRQVSMSYAGQFFDVCREVGAKVYALNGWKEKGYLREGSWTLHNAPVPYSGRRGLLHHVGQFGYGLYMLALACRHRSDLAVVGGGTHWFVLSLFRLAGIAVVPSLHCVLWRKYSRPKGRVARAIRRMNGWFFGRVPLAVLSASDEIARQIQSITGVGNARPLVEFLPTYEMATFPPAGTPPPAPRPFRLLFVGRVEVNKGVFELLQMARDLRDAGHPDIEVDVCGTGSALDRLVAEARAAGLESAFRCHGHCLREKMRQMYASCHAVIVPTTDDFVEGFNQVVVEAVLAGRPVIASSVCPALAYVRDAVLEVAPGDVKGYGAAVLRLRDEPGLRESMTKACEGLKAQFMDARRSWAGAFRHVMRAYQSGTRPSEVSWLRPRN